MTKLKLKKHKIIKDLKRAIKALEAYDVSKEAELRIAFYKDQLETAKNEVDLLRQYIQQHDESKYALDSLSRSVIDAARRLRYTWNVRQRRSEADIEPLISALVLSLQAFEQEAAPYDAPYSAVQLTRDEP